MFCVNCGENITQGVKFCALCGTEINTTAVVNRVIREKTGSRPWIRLWARWLDLLIFGAFSGLVFFPILVIIIPPLDEFLAYNWVVNLVISLFVVIGFEILCLGLWGTTLGKKLLGVRLVLASGQNIKEYVKELNENKNDNRQKSQDLTMKLWNRTLWGVWMRGLGFNIPIINVITQIVAYRTLKNKGITSWDAKYGFKVEHGDVTTGRYIFSAFISFIFLTILVFSLFDKLIN